MSGPGSSHLHLVRGDDSVAADRKAPPGLPWPLSRPRVLLIGDVAARPDGLERALVRAGFEIAEAPADEVLDKWDAEAILITTGQESVAAGLLGRLDRPAGVPAIVVLRQGSREAVVRLLNRGAADVLSEPVDTAELCARVQARVRAGRDAAYARRVTAQTAQLFEAFQEISGSTRPEETLHALVRQVGGVFDLSHCACVLWTPLQAEGRLVALYENPRVRDDVVDMALYPEVTEAVRTAGVVFVPDVQTSPLFLQTRAHWTAGGAVPDVRSAAAVPLTRQGRAMGAVVLRSRVADPVLGPEQIRFAELLVRGTARVLETQERRAAIVRRQGVPDTRDPLTGCGSLDALDRRLQEEFERARRYGLSFTLVLLDLDGLSRLNERHGMEVGDRALAELGALLQREIRAPDFVARYGGDEFALVLPETDVEGARRTIRRVWNRVADHPFADLSSGDRPALSAGLVTYPHPVAIHPEDLFALAESALLRAKATDGERIGVAEPLPT